MKKILSMLVVLSIVVLSAMGAFAADYLPDDNGRYTVVVEGLQKGEMYGMVAIKGTQASQITEANIVYIDQATADSEGKITFASFGTMGDATEATVFVGGAGYTSATAIGTLKAAAAPEPEVIPVTAVTLNETAKELEIGGTVTLVATVEPSNATDATVTWETSDAAIAEVVDGLVTAKAAGTATITAKAGDKSATCTITVKAAAAPVAYGDVDGSGKINIADVTNLSRCVAKWTDDKYTIGKGIIEANADVDASGKINIADVTALSRHVAKWSDYATLPYKKK